MKYSPSTKGFYLDSDADAPVDCVTVPQSEYQRLLDADGHGAVITPDENGYPVLVPCKKSSVELWADYQQQAKAALDRTDAVALRCWKAGVPFPADWQEYTNNLRDIVRASSGDPTHPIPPQPEYPSGT